jgi:AcrR family transcriptional regulator
MARPRQHDDRTRELLLTSAGRLLTQAGPAAVTTRAVAAEAGVTTRAIYALFGSKAGLLRALHRAGFEGLAAALDAVERSDDPVADLRALAVAYRASARDRPHLYQAMFGGPIEDLEPDPDDVALAASTLQRLADVVARCQATGRLPGDDPWPATRALWALVHGLASLELRGALGERADADDAWDTALDTVGVTAALRD